MSIGLEVDLKQLVVSTSAFGPREIDADHRARLPTTTPATAISATRSPSSKPSRIAARP